MTLMTDVLYLLVNTLESDPNMVASGSIIALQHTWRKAREREERHNEKTKK